MYRHAGFFFNDGMFIDRADELNFWSGKNRTDMAEPSGQHTMDRMVPPFKPGGARRPPLPLMILAAGIAAATLLPMAYLAIRALESGFGVFEIVFRPRTLSVFLNTAILAGTVTAGSVIIGVLIAWLTVRTDLPWRKFWATTTCLPLVLPSYVGAFALVGALGPTGMVQSLLQPLGVERLPSIYGFPGAWLALTLFTYPYVQLSVRGALRGLDPSLEDAARSLGRSAPRVFREITLPHLRPSIHAGALLVVLYTLSDFGAVSLLQFNSFTRAIYVQYTSALDRSAAAVLAMMLVMLTFVILMTEYRMRGRALYYRSSSGSRRPPTVVPLGKWRLPALIFVSLVSLMALGVPLTVIVYWLFRGLMAGEQFAPHAQIAFNSLIVSGQAAVAGVMAAFPIVILAVRHPGMVSRVCERCTYVAHSLPGIAVALALVFFGARYVPALYQSMAMLVFAYVILFLPLAVGSLRASMLQLSPRLEEAGRILGRSSGRVLWSVTFPLMRPGILMGLALVFLSCMKELPATLILGPTGFNTLATRIWGATEEAFFARAAAPALILVLVSAISLWIMFAHEEGSGSRGRFR